MPQLLFVLSCAQAFVHHLQIFARKVISYIYFCSRFQQNNGYFHKNLAQLLHIATDSKHTTLNPVLLAS